MVVDSLPPRNPAVNFLRGVAKALLFRKRIIRTRRVVFPGVADAALQTVLDVGNGRGEVLARTLVTAVSPGTERGYYLDLPDFHQERPFVPGYSGSGIVSSNRTRVEDIRRGSLVAGIFKHASWNILPEGSLVVVPPGVTPLQAAFITLGVIARCGVRAAGIEPGERVMVLGQGVLGQLAVQMARAAGAGWVGGAALTRSKERFSRESGVDEFYALSERKIAAEEIRADRVIDVTGSVDGFDESIRIVRPGGRVVMLGSIPGYGHESDWSRGVWKKKLEVRGAHIRNLEAEGLTYAGEAKAFLDSVASGEIKIDHLITHELTPSEVPDFYRALAEGSVSPVGVIINWK